MSAGEEIVRALTEKMADGRARNWTMGRDGVRRWVDTGEPIEDDNAGKDADREDGADGQ